MKSVGISLLLINLLNGHLFIKMLWLQLFVKQYMYKYLHFLIHKKQISAEYYSILVKA